MGGALKLVRPADDGAAAIADKRAERLRRLIRERDDALRTVATCERHIAHEARRWADAQGLTLRPTVEQLKRELFK